ARARDERPGARLAAHLLAERRGIRQRGGDDVPRRHVDAAHANRLRRVEPALVQRLQHGDELLAEHVLERDAIAIDPARDQHDLFVLHVHALERPDTFGEVEHLGLRERLRREPAALAFPDERRVETLLDRRPDRERRCEVVAVDDEVRAVAHTDLVELREELVGGVPREDVGKSWLDADAGEAEKPRLAPPCVLVELFRAEQDARGRQRHRHVEIGDARLLRRVEDRRVEARVARVEDRVRLRCTCKLDDRGDVRGVDRGCVEAVIEAGDRTLRTRLVDVGERHVLEERPASGDRCGRAANAACSDNKDLHALTLPRRSATRPECTTDPLRSASSAQCTRAASPSTRCPVASSTSPYSIHVSSFTVTYSCSPAISVAWRACSTAASWSPRPRQIQARASDACAVVTKSSGVEIASASSTTAAASSSFPRRASTSARIAPSVDRKPRSPSSPSSIQDSRSSASAASGSPTWNSHQPRPIAWVSALI